MQWLALSILLLAAVGHVTIVRVLFNWTFLLHMPERLWYGLVLLTAAVAGFVPLAMLVGVGFTGPAVLRGGAWADVPAGWLAYLALCCVAAVVGAGVLIRRHLAGSPAALVSNHTETADVAALLGERPLGHGRRAGVALAPWNELFVVDFAEKQLRVPRLPKEWDGLSILHLTDLHFHGTPDRPFFEHVFERCAAWGAEMAVLSGDVLDDPAMADWLPTTLGGISAPFGRYFVLGNHDTHAEPERTRSALERLGWESVASKWVERTVRGKPMLIAGTERPWIGTDPDLAGAPGGMFRLLVSHAPHLVKWARRRDFDLVLAGHLHGGQIRLPLIGPVTGGRFHAGLFDLPPTLMHVGRGLGQLTPIRFRCKPEVTKLILRASTGNP